MKNLQKLWNAEGVFSGERGCNILELVSIWTFKYIRDDLSIIKGNHLYQCPLNIFAEMSKNTSKVYFMLYLWTYWWRDAAKRHHTEGIQSFN